MNLGLELIARFEGCSLVPYLCPAGYWTIGYGHVADRGHRPITPQEAKDILGQDAAKAAAAVARFVTVPLTQNQCDALTSFTFNVGAAALQRSTLRRVINRGEHDQVPEQLLRWVWGGGRKLPGLVKRRQAEAALYSLN